jgi:chaperonin GroES
LTKFFLLLNYIFSNQRSLLLIKIMNFKPLSNHVFIEPIEEEKTTKSGIVLPETAEKERPIRGRVIAIGPGKLNEKGERIPMSVKVGDVVLFKKYGPDEIEIDDKKYLVGDEDDILAIIE